MVKGVRRVEVEEGAMMMVVVMVMVMVVVVGIQMSRTTCMLQHQM